MAEPRILPMKVRQIPIDDVQPHPDNARAGDLRAIADSLTTNGQYRPLVVQKSSGYILCGNHTWEAARSLGWKHAAIQYVDVGDRLAKRILLADNRTSDTAEYEHEALAGLLSELGETTGTGFTDHEFAAIVGTLDTDLPDTDGLPELDTPDPAPEPRPTPPPEIVPAPPAPTPPPPAPTLPSPAPAPREPVDRTPAPAPVGEEKRLTVGYPSEDHHEAVTLIAEVRKAFGGDVDGAEVILRALRTLMAALDARHDPDAKISIAQLLRNAE